MTQRIVSLMH